MAKWHGKIGFGDQVETVPGVWKTVLSEYEYAGEMFKNTRSYESAGNQNENLNISNRLSIIANPYAFENFHLIKYVTFMGTRWKVTDVEVEYPRLILTLGGIYNGQ